MRGTRVVSWNIERGYQPTAIVQTLRALEADLLLLTEIDRGCKRTGGIDMFERLQEGLGLAGHYAVEFVEHDSIWRTLIPKGGPGGGVHGNAILCRQPLTDYRVIDLPVNDALRWEGRTIIPELFEPRTGHRIAQLARIDIGGLPVTVANLHLENWRSSPAHRQRQLSTALSAMGPGVRLLAGDLNPIGGILGTFGRRAPVHAEVRSLRRFLAHRGLRDPFADTDYTHRILGLKGKLDWLCASPELSFRSSRVIDPGISDHALLLADVGPVAGVPGDG